MKNTEVKKFILSYMRHHFNACSVLDFSCQDNLDCRQEANAMGWEWMGLGKADDMSDDICNSDNYYIDHDFRITDTSESSEWVYPDYLREFYNKLNERNELKCESPARGRWDLCWINNHPLCFDKYNEAIDKRTTDCIFNTAAKYAKFTIILTTDEHFLPETLTPTLVKSKSSLGYNREPLRLATRKTDELQEVLDIYLNEHPYKAWFYLNNLNMGGYGHLFKEHLWPLK